MGSNNITWFIPVLAMQMVFIACEQKPSELRGQPPRSPFSENNSATVAHFPSNHPPITTNTTQHSRRPVNGITKTKDAQNSESTPEPNQPLGPGPGQPFLPIPTDDDLPFDDSFVGRPFVPFGKCGNSKREPGEQCDDGNQDNKDGCSIVCQSPYCGNGVQEKGEECDDNNQHDGDGCSSLCQYERCGNMRIDHISKDTLEQCDDGNLAAGDGCSPCCMFEICGNSVIDTLTPKTESTPATNEQCDDGNITNGDGCSDCCKIES